MSASRCCAPPRCFARSTSVYRGTRRWRQRIGGSWRSTRRWAICRRSGPHSNAARPRRAFISPHHAVVRSTDGKLRVVFNASSPTSNGTSLNDHMLVGPKLQRDLLTVLLQWRLPRFALKADNREDVPPNPRAPERRRFAVRAVAPAP